MPKTSPPFLNCATRERARITELMRTPEGRAALKREINHNSKKLNRLLAKLPPSDTLTGVEALHEES